MLHLQNKDLDNIQA